MASLNDLLLKRVIRNPLVDIGFRVSDDRGGQWDLKSLLLGGQLSVESIAASGRCKLSLGDEVYFDALESTFFSGVVRYIKQKQICEQLRREATPPAAWNVVTLYYACFFCVVELLRVAGIWSIFLTSSEAKRINDINPIGTAFASGTYSIAVSNDGSSFKAFIAKADSSGGGFHQIIWDRFCSLVRIKPSLVTDTYDRNRYRAFLEGLNPKSSPSVLRNKWNYRECNLFSSYGESIASQTLYAGAGSEQAWIRSYRHINTANDEIFALLNIHDLTSSLINDGLRYILPERKREQIRVLRQ